MNETLTGNYLPASEKEHGQDPHSYWLVSKQRKYLRLVIGGITLIIGIGFMLIPFIPIGYAIIFVAVFLLSPYIPFLARLMRFFKTKDKNGNLNKLEKKVCDFEMKILRFLFPQKYRKDS